MIIVDVTQCVGCGTCKADCPSSNISLRDGKAVHGNWCLECGHCAAVCPQNAVSMSGAGYDPADVLEYDDPQRFAIEPDRLLIDKTLLLMVWSIWGMYLPVKGHFHRKIRVGYTVCGSAAVLQSPVALFLRNLHVGEAI